MAQNTENPVDLFDMHVAHVGINAADEKDADDIAGEFETLMGLVRDEKAPSVFAGTLVEVMKRAGRGERGHIGFHVNDIAAAEEWFAGRGLEVDESSRVTNPDGSTFLVYFKRQIGGFAIHLTVAT
ncbi:MAG: VOC family protein [Coriobacteriaceae bacterium]|uniref:VOC family protein n=1 Tax=Tractidigestivibacter sp. TaxID=2847320 RepID=UPI002A808EC3|nr:VOC family protein [Tractidigestivibacter sp.]MCI6274539.1 VOC family protein [Coriobacteriaceae bacterium]MCI6548858.1 VOC family protein [Coriobacteriaceae bacterium]MCI6844041.1 VOC family protein [Coriobacteriaceae bacterium]MDD7583726.1 VOC family protein [Coriobacteriaceae bacterium]MDY4534300.1 VOC family protein [Tractidigestivibacter sp.]